MLFCFILAATAVNPLLLQEGEVQEELNQDALAIEQQAIQDLEETKDEVAFEFEDEFDGEE